MKNKLGHLDEHLFAALERLGDEDMTPEQIEAETKKAAAFVAISDQIVDNARLKLNAAKLYAEHGEKIVPMLPQIGKAPE